MIISMIAAVSENKVIGKDNGLVWSLPNDMKYFMDTTKGHHIITGRKNYESIPVRFRPLKERTNIIITHQEDYTSEGALVVHSIDEGIELARKHQERELFIIGGGEIYRQALSMANRLYITEVKGNFEGDTFFPDFVIDHWTETSRIKNKVDDNHAYAYEFVIYDRKI